MRDAASPAGESGFESGVSPAAIGKASTTPRIMLWTLLIVYTLNFLDRQILNILAEPIKRDLVLSDTGREQLEAAGFILP